MLFQALCIIWSPLVNSNRGYSPETANLGKNRQFFEPCDLQIWRMTLKNNRAPLLAILSFVHHFVYSNLSYKPETPNLGQIRRFLELCYLEIWQMTLKNNRAPLQCCFKLCASFRSHWLIQTGVTVRKHTIWVKFDVFFKMCDLEIWQMTLKTVAHLS